MRNSLVTFLTTAALSTGYAFADGPVERPSAERYIPPRITNTCQGTYSTEDIKIDEEPTTINGKQYVVYANEFSKDGELEFMLREPNSGIEVYNFGEGSGVVVPTEFLIPTRLIGENSAGETVPARKFIYTGKISERTPINLTTFGYNDKEFFHPTRDKNCSTDSSEFYFIPVFNGSENITRNRQTGEVTIFGEDNNGILEKGEGVFYLRKASYEELAARKTVHEMSEKIRQETEKSRLEDEAKVPQSGTGTPQFN